MLQPKFNQYRRGDTFNGRKYKFPFSLVGVGILMQFKTNKEGRATFEFKTEDNSIAVPDPLSGEMFMEKRLMNYKPDKYFYDIQLTFADGIVRTYAEDIMVIFQDVSR